MENLKIEELKIRFKGEDDIELETFTDSLKALVNSLTKIADETIQENEFCKFKVTNIEKGSFVIVIQSILKAVPTLLPEVPTVLNTFKTVLDIKKHLKGKEPEKIQRVNNKQVSITNNYGKVQSFNADVVNIYTSSNDIEKYTSDFMSVVNKDCTRKGVEFTFSGECDNVSKIDFNVEETRSLSIPIDIEKYSMEDVTEEIETYLTVTKLDLEGNSKWTVYMTNNKINVDILDNKFYELVHKRVIHFVANMTIKAKVRIKYKKLPSGVPDSRSKAIYSIVEVLEVEQQGEMMKVSDLEIKLFN